ncbi:hypothetical protein ACFL96_03735 [Thermoproteota archaeon]
MKSKSKSILYSYITKPGKTIQERALYKPLLESILILTLFSLSLISGLPILFSPGSFIFWFLSMFSISLGIVFCHSVTLDFLAQIFRYKSQSLRLFSWFGLSVMPMLLLVPLNFLLTPLAKFVPGLAALFMLAVLVSTISLQIVTFKTLYRMSLRTSILIYFSPLLIILAFTGIMVVLGMILALIAFH